MGIKAVRKALKNKSTDEFEVGDVIQWVMTYEVDGVEYTYAAIKTVVGWVTTARVRGTVGQTLTFSQLLEVLAKPEASDVLIATEWTLI